MIIVQINTVAEFSSTGRTTIELAKALDERGHISYIAYGQKNSTFYKSFKIGSALENHIHNAFSRIFGNQGYYSKKGTKKLISCLKAIKPDIIHLRNLHGNYINLKLLFEYLQELTIPIVWTLHDCWAYTGKCVHYTEVNCYKWETYCKKCVQVKKYPPSFFFDRTEEMFNDKKIWASKLKNLTIITVSDWLKKEVKKSFLSNRNIYTIYNWIDHNVFYPRYDSLKEKYGIQKNKFVILGISASWKKNSSKFRDFIRLSKLLLDDMQIVLVGKGDVLNEIENNIFHIPYVEDVNELASIYSMADVYVHLALEDTFGKVIVEAMSCGTPAIAYKSTVYPELINVKCGYIVEKRNIKAVFNALKKIKTIGKIKYSKHCIFHAKKTFSYKKNVKKQIELYEKLQIHNNA